MMNSYGSMHALKASFGDLKFNFKTTLIHLFNTFFNRKLHKQTKLNIGCGRDIKPGFCNIDFGKRGDLFLDVRNPMPFKDSSISYIYSSHFVEHLTHRDLMFHLREGYRMLKAGGVYRIAIPDFPRTLRSYVEKDEKWFRFLESNFPLDLSKFDGLSSNELCHMDYLNIALHEYFGEHKICLDYEKIEKLLIHVGFKKENIRQTEFLEGFDRPVRRDFSIFIEVSK